MCIPKETTEAGSPLHSKNITQKKEYVDKNRKKTKGEKFKGMLEEKGAESIWRENFEKRRLPCLKAGESQFIFYSAAIVF